MVAVGYVREGVRPTQPALSRHPASCLTQHTADRMTDRHAPAAGTAWEVLAATGQAARAAAHQGAGWLLRPGMTSEAEVASETLS